MKKLTKATIVRVPIFGYKQAFELIKSGEADAFADLRDALPRTSRSCRASHRARQLRQQRARHRLCQERPLTAAVVKEFTRRRSRPVSSPARSTRRGQARWRRADDPSQCRYRPIVGAFRSQRPSSPLAFSVGSRPGDNRAPPATLPRRDHDRFAFGRDIAGLVHRGRPGAGVVPRTCAGQSVHMVPRARLLAAAGFSVPLFDFQAHGEHR